MKKFIFPIFILVGIFCFDFSAFAQVRRVGGAGYNPLNRGGSPLGPSGSGTGSWLGAEGVGGITVGTNGSGALTIDGSGIVAGAFPSYGITNRFAAAGNINFTNFAGLRQIGTIHLGDGTASNSFLYLNASSNVVGGTFGTGLEFSGGALSSAVVTNANILYVSMNGNNTTALRGRPDKPWREVTNAVNAMVAGDTVVIGPGRWTNNSAMALPYGGSLVGAGRDLTIITNTGILGTVGPALVPATNSVIRDFTTETTYFTDEELRALIGKSANSPNLGFGYENALAYNVNFKGGSDSVYVLITNACTMQFVNCAFYGDAEDVIVQSLTNAHSMTFRNCNFNSVGGNPGVGTLFTLKTTAGYVGIFNSHIDMTNAAAHTAFVVGSGAILELADISFNLAASPVQITNAGTVLIRTPSNFDPYLLKGGGTYTYSQNNFIFPSGGTSQVYGVTYYDTATAQTFAMFDGGKIVRGTVPTNAYPTHAQLVTASNNIVGLISSAGDVFGPASVIDKQLAVWGGTSGDRLTNSPVTLDPVSGQMLNVGDFRSTGTVYAAGVQVTNIPGVGPPSAAGFFATNQTQAAWLQGAYQMTYSVTNILGLLEVSDSSTIIVDCNKQQFVNKTNRMTGAMTILLTNAYYGQTISGTLLGEVAGGTSRIVTFVPSGPALMANLYDQSAALSLNTLDITVTNGYGIEWSVQVAKLTGTNCYKVAYGYFKY